MAYNATVNLETTYVSGVQHIVATIVETGVTSATDEYTVSVPRLGSLHLHICTLTPGDGTATTIDPDLFEISSTTETQRRLLNNGAAAVFTRSTPTGAHYYTVDGLLRGHSGANGNTGTTGYITTIIRFAADSAN